MSTRSATPNASAPPEPPSPMIVAMIGRGYGDEDFMRLLSMEAESAGLEIQSEDADVGDGLA